MGSSIYAVVHTWPGDHMRSVEENSVVREWRKLFADLFQLTNVFMCVACICGWIENMFIK